jgi:hypothetical protein
MAAYRPPLDTLLTLGQARMDRKWPDYSTYGVTSEHIPDLIRMATDPGLHHADRDSKEIWAPVHAWRALGQLQATEAIEPLLDLLEWAAKNADDWALNELPTVLAMIGAPAIPSLTAFLADDKHDRWPRLAAADALKDMTEKHPETRTECTAFLIRQLERAAENPQELNASLIAHLIDLEAVEAAPVMERAYAAGLVDEMMCGDWEHAQYELGLTDEPPDDDELPPATESPFVPLPGFFDDRAPRDHKAKAKARRKMAAKSRRRNRKKK